VLTFKIVSFIFSPTIEYAFLLRNKEMRNAIDKKDVAFLKKSYREHIDLEKESRDYFNSLAVNSCITAATSWMLLKVRKSLYFQNTMIS